MRSAPAASSTPHDLGVRVAAVAEDHGLRAARSSRASLTWSTSMPVVEDRADVRRRGRGRRPGSSRRRRSGSSRRRSGCPRSTSRSIATRPGLARDEQRVVAVGVLEVDVGARVDQDPRDVDVIAERGRGDGGAAATRRARRRPRRRPAAVARPPRRRARRHRPARSASPTADAPAENERGRPKAPSQNSSSRPPVAPAACRARPCRRPPRARPRPPCARRRPPGPASARAA